MQFTNDASENEWMQERERLARALLYGTYVGSGTDIRRQHSKQERKFENWSCHVVINRVYMFNKTDCVVLGSRLQDTKHSVTPTSIGIRKASSSAAAPLVPTGPHMESNTPRRIYRQVGLEPPAALPLRKLTSMFMLAFGSAAAAALSRVDAMRADDTASNDSLFGRFPGDRSPSCTRLGPSPFPTITDEFPPPSDARACGDS